MACTVSSLCSGEAFLNVVSASDNPQQARVGYGKIIRILDILISRCRQPRRKTWSGRNPVRGQRPATPGIEKPDNSHKDFINLRKPALDLSDIVRQNVRSIVGPASSGCGTVSSSTALSGQASKPPSGAPKARGLTARSADLAIIGIGANADRHRTLSERSSRKFYTLRNIHVALARSSMATRGFRILADTRRTRSPSALVKFSVFCPSSLRVRDQMVQGVRREWIKRTRIPQNRAVTHATVPAAPVRPAAALSDAGRTHGALEMNENIQCRYQRGATKQYPCGPDVVRE